ncbi:MAG: helix-turn-helix transcriptional regulator [Myxococcota bacterium]
MSALISLITDRVSFESLWREALEQHGFGIQSSKPDHLISAAREGAFLVVDADCHAFDENELLLSVGFARAVGAVPVASMASTQRMRSVDDVIDELCFGLVARGEADVPRIAAALARRANAVRSERFEFVTVSPREHELLVIMGDGRSILVPRPIGTEDSGAEIAQISLADDAYTATLELSDGATLKLKAAEIERPQRSPTRSADAAPPTPIDGAKLGARLRELRLKAQLTQAELARRTGIHRPNIARVEAGRHTPSLETLSRLATAIGVSTTLVLSED